MHKRFKLLEIVSAVLIPFIAGMFTITPYSAWIIGILGIVVAVAAGADSLCKFQENWIQYRTTSETLTHEKYLYLTKSAHYSDFSKEEDAFINLVKRVESLISKENTQWANKSKTKK